MLELIFIGAPFALFGNRGNVTTQKVVVEEEEEGNQ